MTRHTDPAIFQVSHLKPFSFPYIHSIPVFQFIFSRGGDIEVLQSMKEFDSAAGRSCSCNAQVAASVRATGNVVDDMKFLEIYRYELFEVELCCQQ
jgi:hypothetical protein